MECTVKCDEFVALGVILGELDCGFDRFGAGIAEINALGSFARRDGSELLGELDHVGIIKISSGHVDQFGGLLLNCSDHIRVAMASGNDSDAGREIEKSVAVHVLDNGAAASLDD